MNEWNAGMNEWSVPSPGEGTLSVIPAVSLGVAGLGLAVRMMLVVPGSGRDSSSRWLLRVLDGRASVCLACDLSVPGSRAAGVILAHFGPFPVWWRRGWFLRVPEEGRNQVWDRHGGALLRSIGRRR